MSDFGSGAYPVHICGAGDLFRFEGWYFEFKEKGYGGPWPLNKDGEPRNTPPGRKFWKMWERFCLLTKKQKKKCMVKE